MINQLISISIELKLSEFVRGQPNKDGRFYQGWWQHVPSDTRRHILIDGKKPLEIDYSGMCMRLLYASEGVELDLNTDVYNLGLDDWMGKTDPRRPINLRLRVWVLLKNISNLQEYQLLMSIKR